MPRTFRLFISSTFNDLKEERNALQQVVFPRLRDLCNEHGYRFQPIDLRWGISAEASLNQKTMRICLEELHRCQEATPTPNFLILLGNRYGWQPLPETLSVDEYQSIINITLTDEEQNTLMQWYKIDENAVPAVYELQPRSGDYADYNVWLNVENQLRQILSKSKTVKENLDKSATELEIINGLLQTKNSNEHVFCFLREFEFDKPIDRIIADRPKESEIFFDTKKENNSLGANGILQAQLEALKDKIRKTIPNNIYQYSVKWKSGDIPSDYLRQFCNDVYSSLSKTILAEIENEKSIGDDALEIKQHQDFIDKNYKDVIGRDREIQLVRDYIENTTSQEPFVIIGESGSGKSSFMVRSAWDSIRNYPSDQFIFRFIGLTPSSLSSEKLLYSIILDLAESFNVPIKLKSRNLSLLQVEFHRLLDLIPDGDILIVHLDAIDRLSGFGDRIPEWIPTKLPSRVKLIVSGTPQCFNREFLSNIPEVNRLTLPKLSSYSAESILNNLLAKQQRKLQDFQQKIVLDNYLQVGLPIYLSIAAAEAAQWQSNQANITLKPDISGIINQVLDSLSLPEKHGEKLVSKVLMFLAASKNGLTEDELLDLLVMDSEYLQFLEKHHKIPIQKLPVALWSRLYMDLKPYLITRSNDGLELYDFYHQAFKKVVEERYFANPNNLASIRSTMVKYYAKQNWFITKCETTIYGRLKNLRKTSELVFQLFQSKEYDTLCNLFCDLNFIEAKCVAQGVDELLGDIELLKTQPIRAKSSERLDQYFDFIVKESDTLRRYPELTIQQAINQRSLQLVMNDGVEKIKNLKRNTSIFRLTQNQLKPSPIKWQFSSNGSIAKYSLSPKNTTIAAISTSGNLLLIDALSGRILQSEIVGAPNLNDCCFCGDGTKIFVLEGNYNLHTYSSNLKRIETRTLSHFADSISVNHHGTMVAAWSGTDLSLLKENGESVKFTGHFKRINQVKFSINDEYLLTVSNDYTICEWSVQEQNLVWKSDAHHDNVYSLDISACGKYMVTSSVDEIIVWNRAENTIIKRINVPFCNIHSVCIKTFDEGTHRIAATGDDGFIRIFLAKEMKSNIGGLTIFDPYEQKLGIGPISKALFLPNSDNQFYIETENMNLLVAELQLSQPEVQKDLGATTVIRHNPKTGEIARGTTDGYTEVVDTKGNVRTNKFHTEYITDLIFTKSGDSIVTAAGDKEIKETSPAHAVAYSINKKNDHSKTARCLVTLYNGKSIASADDAGVINVYGLNDGYNFEEPSEMRFGAFEVFPTTIQKPLRIPTGKGNPVLCMQQIPNTDCLLVMDKLYFVLFDINQGQKIASVEHSVEMAYKFVYSNGRIFLVSRKGSISSFILNLSSTEITLEKTFVQKASQCNGISLLNDKALILANQNGTVQAFLLPHLSPVGIFSAGEPIMAIDTSESKKITVGLASARFIQLEFNLVEIVSNN